jgi:hypothetical protein
MPLGFTRPLAYTVTCVEDWAEARVVATKRAAASRANPSRKKAARSNAGNDIGCVKKTGTHEARHADIQADGAA